MKIYLTTEWIRRLVSRKVLDVTAESYLTSINRTVDDIVQMTVVTAMTLRNRLLYCYTLNPLPLKLFAKYSSVRILIMFYLVYI